MKKLYFILNFILITFSAFSQTLNEEFAGWADIVSIAGSNPYTIVIKDFAGNPRKYDDTWALSDMQIGDVLWTATGSKYNITGISGFTLTVSDPDPGLSVLPAISSRIGFGREFLVNGYLLGSIPQAGDGNAGTIVGVSITTHAFILNHYLKNIRTINTIATEVYVYSGGIGVLPGTSPPTITQYLARNSANELYRWDGTNWVLIENSNLTIYGLFKNNADAAANSVPLNGIYQASLDNELGYSTGTLIMRKN